MIADRATLGRVARRQLARPARLAEILIRDGEDCVWCGRTFDARTRPTTDHVIPRVKGGPSWTENEVAACRRCNAERGHLSPADWLAECERRTWPANRPTIIRRLGELTQAIDQFGGQRRARGYLAGQLRRLT